MVTPGLWRKSMLHVYGCVFCSICLLSVYMCVRIPLSAGSIAGVPSSRRPLVHTPVVEKVPNTADTARDIRNHTSNGTCLHCAGNSSWLLGN